MKRAVTLVASLILTLAISSVAMAETTIIETLTLQPGEARAFTIEAQAKTKIGFTPKLSSAENDKCKNNCIQISQEGGVTMASLYGATIGMTPVDGKIEVELENLEDFPIEVELYRK